MGWTFSSALLGSSGSKKAPEASTDSEKHTTKELSHNAPPILKPVSKSLSQHTPKSRTTSSNPSIVFTVNRDKEEKASDHLRINPVLRLQSVLGTLSPTALTATTPAPTTIQITSIPIVPTKSKAPADILKANVFPASLKRLAHDEDIDPLRKKSRTQPQVQCQDVKLGQIVHQSLFEKAPVSEYTNIPLQDINYRLRYVIQGYAEVSATTEKSPFRAWNCEFEPGRNDCVAVCGLNQVLFLDTEQGQYTKKFVNPEKNEIFYAIAWTSVKEEHVLAVAGQLGSIKLLSQKTKECYRCLFGHSKAVTALTFSKKRPTWLFSASDDRSVRLWEIGTVDFHKDNSQCLAKFAFPTTTTVPTSLSVSFDLSMIAVGMENGDIIDFEITASLLKSFYARAKQRIEGVRATIELPVVESSYLYPHGDEWHEGFIDGVYILGQDGGKENQMNNKIVSRGVEDMEMIVWDPYESTNSDAAIDIALHWPESDGSAGTKFKVIESQGHKSLIAGDYKGQIRIYDIGCGKKSRTLSDNSKEQYLPDKVLIDKMSSSVIRDICCSDDNSTIIAISSDHTLYVWTAAISLKKKEK